MGRLTADGLPPHEISFPHRKAYDTSKLSFKFPRAMRQVPCLHEHKANFIGFANAEYQKNRYL